jgi:hypothetical protein
MYTAQGPTLDHPCPKLDRERECSIWASVVILLLGSPSTMPSWDALELSSRLPACPG